MSESRPAPPKDLPGSLRLTIVWLLIGTVVFLAIQALMNRAERSRFSFDAASGAIELRRAPDGHFHWPGQLNGQDVVFMVDTGATSTAIPRQLADELKLRDEGSVMSSTAGGVVSGTWTRADLTLEGGPRVERLRVTVLPRLDAPLLGMDVLSKMRFTQSDGVLRLQAGARP
jgi:aspartyl protease family protein